MIGQYLKDVSRYLQNNITNKFTTVITNPLHHSIFFFFKKGRVSKKLWKKSMKLVNIWWVVIFWGFWVIFLGHKRGGCQKNHGKNPWNWKIYGCWWFFWAFWKNTAYLPRIFSWPPWHQLKKHSRTKINFRAAMDPHRFWYQSKQ